jgi:hypothetical protein
MRVDTGMADKTTLEMVPSTLLSITEDCMENRI